jgi:hypothetical protein
MNLSVAGFLSFLLLPILLGTGILRACGVGLRSDRLAFFGWCWITGTTGTALVTFGWLWTGAAVDHVLPLQLAIVVLAAFLHVAGSRRGEPVPDCTRGAFPAWERGLFCVVVAVCLFVTAVRALLGNLEPLCHGDDAAFWAFKAKIIYASGGFNQAFADVMSIPEIVYHKDYPLLHPLLHVWTFAHAGEITQVANRVAAQMFSFALVLILAAALRHVARPAVAAALLLCVMPLPEMIHQARTAYVDNTVAVGLVMAFDAWSRWRRSESDTQARAWWRLFCLTLALILWSKHEGFLYVLAMLAAWLVGRAVRKRDRTQVVGLRRVEGWMLLLPAGVLALTWSFNLWFGFQSYVVAGRVDDAGLVGSFVNQLPSRVPLILDYFAREIVFNPSHSNLLPLAFFVFSSSLALRIWRNDLRTPTLALLFAFGAYVVVFVETPAEITSHLRTAAERVSYQLVPAIALWLGYAGALLLAPPAGDEPPPLTPRSAAPAARGGRPHRRRAAHCSSPA